MYRFKISLVITLSIMLILSSFSSVIASAQSDIINNWAKETIVQWMERGLIEGYEDGTFRPNNNITRAEAAALINRSFELDNRADIAFSDVTPAQWFYSDVSTAIASGYMSGYPDGSFKPNNGISRQELAVMISNLLELPKSSAYEALSDQATIPHWSKEAIGAVIDANIMNGYPDGSFKADQLATRAEVVVVLDQAFRQSGRTVTYYYNKPGTYGPSTGTKVIEGNVVVNSADVTLTNFTINGDLLLGEGIGDGEAYIKNVTVNGTTRVEGGGANSIHFENSVLVSVLVNKANNSIRIVLEGSSSIQEVVLYSGAILEEAEGTSGDGFNAVTLSEQLPEESLVELKGAFETVEVKSKTVKVSIPVGSIKSMNVAEGADGTQIEISKEAKIIELILDAVTKVLGEGEIDKATVNVDGTSFENKPAQTEVKPGVTTNIGNETLTSSPPAPPSSPPSSGGNNKNVLVTQVDVFSEYGVTKVVYGNTLQMKALVTPDHATNKTITWSVTNGTGFATITESGLLTATGYGNVTVTATNEASGISGSQEIIIVDTPILRTVQYAVLGANGTLSAVARQVSDPSVITPIASGDQIEEGSIVTFTATPDAVFKVGSWLVNDQLLPTNQSNPLHITVNGDLKVELIFELDLEKAAIPVSTEEELREALADPEVLAVRISNDIMDIDETVIVDRSVVIVGDNHTLSFTSALNHQPNGQRQGLLIKSDQVFVLDLLVSMSGDEGWQGVYGIQIYDAKNVVLVNVTASGADGGILINASTVNLVGNIVVSGNEFGGIEVSRGAVPGLHDSDLTVTGYLINDTEAYGKPTIWVVNGQGIVNNLGRLLTTNTAIKADQTQYYLNEDNAIDPLPSKTLTISKVPAGPVEFEYDIDGTHANYAIDTVQLPKVGEWFNIFIAPEPGKTVLKYEVTGINGYQSAPAGVWGRTHDEFSFRLMNVESDHPSITYYYVNKPDKDKSVITLTPGPDGTKSFNVAIEAIDVDGNPINGIEPDDVSLSFVYDISQTYIMHLGNFAQSLLRNEHGITVIGFDTDYTDNKVSFQLIFTTENIMGDNRFSDLDAGDTVSFTVGLLREDISVSGTLPASQ